MGEMARFLPVYREGLDGIGVHFLSDDADMDPPGFGAAILCWLLEEHGHRVGTLYVLCGASSID